MKKQELQNLTEKIGKECNYNIKNNNFKFVNKILYQHNNSSSESELILKESEEKRLMSMI